MEKVRRVAAKCTKSAVADSRHESVLEVKTSRARLRSCKSAASALKNVKQILKKAGFCDQSNST
jgi:hypothetical protein